MSDHNENKPEFKLDMNTYHGKAQVAAAIGMPESTFKKLINNGYLYEKLKTETNYQKNQKYLYPIQLALIETEYGGLMKNEFN